MPNTGNREDRQIMNNIDLSYSFQNISSAQVSSSKNINPVNKLQNDSRIFIHLKYISIYNSIYNLLSNNKCDPCLNIAFTVGMAFECFLPLFVCRQGHVKLRI